MPTRYGSNLDGTLLDSKNHISQHSLAVPNRQITRGQRFTDATSRSRISAAVVTEGLTIDIPAVVYNGTLIMQTTTGDILYSQTFHKEEQFPVRRVLTDHKLCSAGVFFPERYRDSELEPRPGE